MSRILITLIAMSSVVTAPGTAIAQDSETEENRPERVRVECPEYLANEPEIIQEKCREATGLHGQRWYPGVTVLVPVAALAASGIILTSLKDDPPVSR
ncbi:hypothetical protein [Sphingomicrobium clamense]|uniref:Uncharacterized protein n=1 Tax=Sphingomicrobium clamense TaxID=2851013 RepID=A0ABS6V6U8_9SPHN|nr:hypothetical protein [Sphingomicrobium sp. B8]MBW0145281.1 hypothetical protein [Sphingomicrobium sp. B8]